VYYDGDYISNHMTSMKRWPSGNDFYTIPSTARFFSLVLFDGASYNGLFSSPDTTTVAGISILNKGDEVAQAIRAITTLTHVKDVIVVTHSMGGLDARAYQSSRK